MTTLILLQFYYVGLNLTETFPLIFVKLKVSLCFIMSWFVKRWLSVDRLELQEQGTNLRHKSKNYHKRGIYSYNSS